MPGPRAWQIAASLLIVITTLAAFPASALHHGRAGDFHFHRVGVAAGLTPDVITTVFRDQSGMLWVGTREGLYRFDGRSVLRFVNDADDPGSISDNSIRTIFQDRSGSLWIGTNTGGLNRLDPGSRSFVAFRSDSADDTTLSHDSIYAVSEDSSGAIWVGTQVGLNRMDPDTGIVTRVPIDRDLPGGPGNEYVATLLIDPDDTIWVGTVGHGLHYRRAGDPQFFSAGPEKGMDDPSIFSLMIDSRDTLWAGGTRGIYRLEKGRQSFLPVPVDHLTDNPVVAITSIVEGPEDHALAGSYSVGVFEIALDSDRARLYSPGPGEEGDLKDGRVTGLVIDAGGGLIVSTWGGGLQRTSFGAREFARLTRMVDSTGLLVDIQDVLALGGDEETGVWAGSNSRGLFRLETVDGTLTALPYPIGDPAGPPAVVSTLPEEGELVWVGTTDGLIRYDAASQSYQHYRNSQTDPTSIGSGFVTVLMRTADRTLWAGTGGSGIWRLNEDGTFTGYRHDPADDQSLSGDYVIALATDEQGHLWIGTRSNGLNRCSTEPFRCRRHPAGPGGGLHHHYVTSIRQDGKGVFWVGTAGGGLHRALRRANGDIEGFEHIGTRDGLVDDNVVSVVEDDDGSLWIGTRMGLSHLHADRRRITNYLANDGLASAVFNPHSAARDDRHLYFGTVDGLVYLNTGAPFVSGSPSPLVFTEARDLTDGTDLSGPLWSLPGVSVPHGNVLQFGFTLLDYESERHSYAYRLKRTKPWIEIEDSRQITFGDLSPGRHELQVRGRGARGKISGTSLPITVVPPFWMTHWFRVLVVSALLLAALGAHNLRMGALQRRNRELQRLHDQRERALERLRRSENERREAAEGLRRLASRLEVAKEEERQHISRELHDELGQTLTAAKISLQLLMQQPAEENRDERLRSAVGMMDSMIGQVRAISLDLRPPLLDEAGLVPALQHELKQASSHTGVPIELRVAEDMPQISPDLETVIFRVTQEAVSNALRHSGADAIKVALGHGGGELTVTIADDGCGFEVEEVRARALRGEHLGLLGLDERVISVGGTARLDSAPGQGTRLTVRIPLGA